VMWRLRMDEMIVVIDKETNEVDSMFRVGHWDMESVVDLYGDKLMHSYIFKVLPIDNLIEYL